MLGCQIVARCLAGLPIVFHRLVLTGKHLSFAAILDHREIIAARQIAAGIIVIEVLPRQFRDNRIVPDASGYLDDTGRYQCRNALPIRPLSI